MRAIVKQLRAAAGLCMSACALSNAVDMRHYDDREAEYMRTVRKYNAEEVACFPRALAELVEALEAEPDDILGKAYMALEIYNKDAGQFFTPVELCEVMAAINIDVIKTAIDARGFATIHEPAVGSGAMIIALARQLHRAGINYQQTMHVTAIDVDIKAVHMAYIQFALLNIPAIIIHGNALTLKRWSVWYTPAHIIGLWDTKLRRGHLLNHGQPQEQVPAPEPIVIRPDPLPYNPATLQQIPLF